MTSIELAARPRDPAAALRPYGPEHGPWDARLAAHLARRACGGADPSELARLTAAGPGAAVDRLFAPRDREAEERIARIGRSLASADDVRGLAAWWLMKLVQERRAPGTRLTLFWHDHFACAQSKVADAVAMERQHALFVERGEGPFEALMVGVLRDVAMLRFLDCHTNRRGQPNENLAREILELFTLGVGHYTEQDIREGARALTGYGVRGGRFHFAPEHHDTGEKRALGRTIRDAEDFCRAAVAQRACPRFLVGKLWAWYVSPEAPEDVVELLAERWRGHDMDVRWLLETMLRSRAFFSRESYRSLVKSPIDYVVGVLRTVGGRPDFGAAERLCGEMGQQLFEPPGVQGWKDGEAWVHAAAWIARANFASRIGRGDEVLLGDASLDRLLPASARGAETCVADALEAFLQSDVPDGTERRLVSALDERRDELVAGAVQSVLTLPEYHLS